MNAQKGSDIKHLAVLFVVAALMIVLYGKIDHTAEAFATWDLFSYIKMAAAFPGLSPDIAPPFAYRILAPYLVGSLPVSTLTGFYVLTIIFSILLLFQFYYLLRYMGLSPAIAAVTVTLFVFNRQFFGLLIWDYFQLNDLIMLNLSCVLFLSLWKGQWVLFGVAFALGALTREVSVLMLPVAFLYLIEKKAAVAIWKKAAIAVTPGLALFVIVRACAPAGEGKSLLEAFASHSRKLYSPESMFRLLIHAFMPLTFIPFLFFDKTVRFLRSRKHMILYVGLLFFSAMFGSNNERLMAPAFIVFYPLIWVILMEIDLKKTALLLILASGFLSSFNHGLGLWPLPNIYWTCVLTFGSTLSITIYMYMQKVKSSEVVKT